jgi:hypothetical protein
MDKHARLGRVLLALSLLTALGEFIARFTPGPLEQAGWLLGDCVMYRNITRALLEHRSVRFEIVAPDELRKFEPRPRRTRPATESEMSLRVDGVRVPKHPLLLPAVLVVPYALLREWGLLLFNVAQCALLVQMVLWLSRRYTTELSAFAAACGFLAASIVRNYTFNVSPDVFGAVLVLGGALLLLDFELVSRRLLVGGLLLGLSLWLRPSNLVGLAAGLPLLTDCIRRGRWRRLAWMASGLLLGASGYLALNYHWFGNPFTTSYDRVVTMTRGVLGLASHRDDFTRPFFSSLIPTLFTHPRSFLQTAPYWPLCIPALIVLARRRWEEALALLTLVAGPVLVIVKYDHWLLSHYGNRFLMLPAAVSAVGIAWLAERLTRSSRELRTTG